MLSKAFSTSTSTLSKSATLDSIGHRFEALRRSHLHLLLSPDRSQLMNHIEFHLGYIAAAVEWTGLSLRCGRIIVQKFVGALLVPRGLRHSDNCLFKLLSSQQLLLVECTLHLKRLVGLDVSDRHGLRWERFILVSGAARGYWALVTYRENQVFSDEGGIIDVFFVNAIWNVVDVRG